VESRQKHREADVWQRRFWEHTVRDTDDLKGCLDYIHYNPVKHGYAKCPHLWPYSSFSNWVERGVYTPTWLCRCGQPDGAAVPAIEEPELVRDPSQYGE
jgi:putative transposase